jgi:hypothetical protein
MIIKDIDSPVLSNYHDIGKPLKIYYRKIRSDETIFFHIQTTMELVCFVVTNKDEKDIVIKPTIFTLQNLPENVRLVQDEAIQEWQDYPGYESYIKKIITDYTQSLALMEILNNYCKLYQHEKEYLYLDVHSSLIQM